MKKKLFYYLFAVLCTATLFTSCSDDDNKNSELPGIIDNEIVGNYKGSMNVFYELETGDVPVAENMLQKITISCSFGIEKFCDYNRCRECYYWRFGC